MTCEEMTCKHCGKEIEQGYFGLKESGECFQCNFWTRIIAREQDGRDVVIKGEKYRLGRETEATPSSWRGYGGRKFVVEFEDGRQVETFSLWREGTVPERFRSQLPDNAKFVGPEA